MKRYRIQAGEIKDQYGNEPTQVEILQALNERGVSEECDDDRPVFTFTAQARSAEELTTYSQASKTELAIWNFEQELRSIWKHGKTEETEDIIDRIWELWHELKPQTFEE